MFSGRYTYQLVKRFVRKLRALQPFKGSGAWNANRVRNASWMSAWEHQSDDTACPSNPVGPHRQWSTLPKFRASLLQGHLDAIGSSAEFVRINSIRIEMSSGWVDLSYSLISPENQTER
jgi:hypothetical protein